MFCRESTFLGKWKFDIFVYCLKIDTLALLSRIFQIWLRMKISVIMNIWVLRFYGYIGDISVNILEKNIDKPKIDQNSWKCKNCKNIIRNIIDILKLFCWKFDICIIWFIIFDDNIICINKKYEFYKCIFIIKSH